MGNVFLHGKGGASGGGSGAGLTIVGGTIRPAKPTQNMIWINTDVEITAYVLSATEPQNPVEGMAWITIGNSGITKLASPVGDEWITVYPLFAKQYVGGAWVDVIAKSYQGGEWADWLLKIFESGKGALRPMKSAQQGQSSCRITSDAIIATVSHQNHQVYATCGTEEPVDLTPFSKVVCEANCTSWVDYGPPHILVGTGGVSTDWGSVGVIAYSYLNVTNSRVKYELDISNINGEYYVLYWGAANTTIYNIWLE